ncbi:hypothetical protein [Halosolutus halophilus]|uniref:hypothetical protein n=1 Tax=Halosolutus halophilus TaxID=1552990 RepID=UPI0022352BB3|nr:hypothetical protein [Halosolutus halophilus]
MDVIWYLDRAAALVAYPALYLAVLTGILYSARSFGPLHRIARRTHIEISVFAMLTTLLHGVLGVLDTWFIVSGSTPQPAYSTTYLLAGVVVGVGALQLLVVAVLGFLDARRFDRPWGPQVVHAFAYGGFGFATIHAAAVGTDVAGLIRPVFGPAIAFLVYVLLLRFLADSELLSTAATADR